MVQKYKDGKTDLKDGPRLGQPRGSATKATIAAVEGMTKQELGFTVKEVAECWYVIGIGSSNFNSTIKT